MYTGNSWTCHFKTDLFDYKTITMPADAACLIDYVQKHFTAHEVTCCYEAGCCGYWIARQLQQQEWMALQTYYRKHAAKEPNKAIIKVAHKLLSRIRAVINSGVPY